MEAPTFDRWTAAVAHRPTRRAALRLLVGGLFGSLLSRREAAPALAQRPDRDGDGLYDDDEVEVYGSDSDNWDTDGDGISDGEEVYLGTDPLTPNNGGQMPAACAQIGQSCAAAECCFGFCTQDLTCDCVNDGFACAGVGTGGCCSGQPCNADGFCGTCSAVGARCMSDAECCQGNYAVLCCFNGTVLTTVCTDVTNSGFICPGEGPAPDGCAAGLTDCGGTCVDRLSHAGHCGACFKSCPLGGTCRGGFCGGMTCPAGQRPCAGYCADLLNDAYNCGSCHNLCDSGICSNGSCAAICFGGGSICTDDSDCCSGDCGLDEVIGAGVCV